MDLNGPGPVETALRRVGELLQARDQSFRIVVLGGAAMNLLGYVSRTTTDVDILAFGGPSVAADEIVPPPEPLPTPLLDAIRTVARDLDLRPDWLNTGPALQWKQALPEGLHTRLHWRKLAGLDVGLVDRIDLIYFKLYAAADHGPASVHLQDLVALAPDPAELEAAKAWTLTQDPSPAFAASLEKVMNHVGRLG